MLGLATITSSILALISDNNTTTSSYDISSGVSKRVQRISLGDPRTFPIGVTEYPAVLMQLKSKTEALSTIGRAGSNKRDIELLYQVTPITYYGAGVGSGQDDAMLDLYKLSSNVEGLLRNKISLSSTADVVWAIPEDTTYEAVKNEQTYCQTAIINLRIKLLTL